MRGGWWNKVSKIFHDLQAIRQDILEEDFCVSMPQDVVVFWEMTASEIGIHEFASGYRFISCESFSLCFDSPLEPQEWFVDEDGEFYSCVDENGKKYVSHYRFLKEDISMWSISEIIQKFGEWNHDDFLSMTSSMGDYIASLKDEDFENEELCKRIHVIAEALHEKKTDQEESVQK